MFRWVSKFLHYCECSREGVLSLQTKRGQKQEKKEVLVPFIVVRGGNGERNGFKNDEKRKLGFGKE